MKQLTSLLAAGVILAAGAANSPGQSTLGPITTSTPILSTLTDWTGTLVFPQFNPSLGSLDSVQLDFSSTVTAAYSVQNVGAVPASGSVQAEVQLTVQDPGNNLSVPEITLLSSAFGYNGLGAGQTATSGLLTESGSISDLYTQAAILSEFTGGGNISLNAGTLSESLLVNRGGFTEAGQLTDASLTGTVEYTYTEAISYAGAVSEPSTSGLLLVGLGCGLPLLRRQRK
jgi:hypothetical protein